ncbi:pyridoxal phosphate-dependent transferase [Phlyctochytrium arcticum]|nr:pyridoxal phosphate-dependent transferase [Phlyctochytrium arcticum]
MTVSERITAIASHLGLGNTTLPGMSSEVSVFSNMPMAPPDAILHLNTLYKADSDPNKINLGVGAYRDEAGKPWVLPVVKKAEHAIVDDPTADHEYLPIDGLKSFTDASAKLIFGAQSPAIVEKRYTACQTISGTGAVRLGAALLEKFRKAPVYISNPTWGNHRAIFQDAGLEVRDYPYWDAQTRGLAINELLQTLQTAPNGSIICLHPCAHNPTGVDPTAEQWKQIAQVMRAKSHFPFFDCAYQGFASGDLARDAYAVRYFVQEGFELLVCQSYSKNIGLYGERTGCLNIVTKTPKEAEIVSSQVCKLQRAIISNPPAFGARIVSRVLNNPAMYSEWEVQLKTMADRIIDMRQQLFNALTQLGTPGTWTHVTDQIGMFSYTGINANQVRVLKDKYHIYMTDNGRISMAGLNSSNVRRFAEALDWVVRNVQ